MFGMTVTYNIKAATVKYSDGTIQGTYDTLEAAVTALDKNYKTFKVDDRS